MNSIELPNCEYFEPGTSLANVIGEQYSYEIIQPIASILSHTDSERQSLNDFENSRTILFFVKRQFLSIS
jgi:hypothetical protein